MTHICVGKTTIIGSDNGLSPDRRQAIIWTNAGILMIGNKLQSNLNRNSNIVIQENAFENVVWKMAVILSRPQCVKVNQWILRQLNQSCAPTVKAVHAIFMFVIHPTKYSRTSQWFGKSLLEPIILSKLSHSQRKYEYIFWDTLYLRVVPADMRMLPPGM